LSLDKTIIDAYKKLSLQDIPEEPEEQLSELGDIVQKFYDASQTRKQAKKVEDKYKKGILLRVQPGESVNLSDIGYNVTIGTRKTIDMDEQKLEYLVREAIKENEDLKDILVTKEVVTIDEFKLNKYIEEGLIDEKEVSSCITIKESPMVKVKKIKDGGKK
jgi:hypothetical protein